MIHHVYHVSATGDAWRQHPWQEDASAAHLVFMMKHMLSASPKYLQSHQADLQPLALEECWQTAGAASLTKRGQESLGGHKMWFSTALQRQERQAA